MSVTVVRSEPSYGYLVLKERRRFVYCCEGCGYEYDSGPNLETHIRSNHQEVFRTDFGSTSTGNVSKNRCEPYAGKSNNFKELFVDADSKLGGVVVNSQKQAEIFILKMDHFEDLFDLLSLKDLGKLSKTCKRMEFIVGFYIKTNYAATNFDLNSSGIHASENYEMAEIKFNGCSSYLRKLVFSYLEFYRFNCIKKKSEQTVVVIPRMTANQFQSLNEILLAEVRFTDDGISRIKSILGQLNTVKLYLCAFVSNDDEFYEKFLQYCTSIKRLCIEADHDTPFIGADNNWLQQKYPTLEHLELTTHICFNKEINELQTFFQQNPNLKTFSTSVDILLANRNIFATTELKLEVLCIEICEFKNRMNISFQEVLVLCPKFLNELEERGMFQQLHLHFSTINEDSFNQEIVNKLVSLNRLTKLFLSEMENGTDLSVLVDLKELGIGEISEITNKEGLVENLRNLEFLQLTYATVDDIMPFIRFLPKLNTIVMFNFKGNGTYVLEIEKLNEVRSNLDKARKITIYVEERVYLATKWTKNGTSSSLIEIKRGTSYEALKNNFDYFQNYEVAFF